MKAVRWSMFANPENASETVVHFLPATPGAATPYPVEISFTVFGRGIQRSRLAVDGARLFHPDGVKLEALFPLGSTDPVSIIAVEVDVYSSQTRSDVSASQCLVEFSSKERPIKFAPRKMILQEDSPTLATETALTQAVLNESVHLVIKDAILTPSIVIVNGTANELRPGIFTIDSKTQGSSRVLLPLGQVPANSVAERKIEGGIFADITPQEMSWGLMKSLAVSTSYSGTDPVSYYLVYRDLNTSKITSVHAL